jgi:hypothetical protein
MEQEIFFTNNDFDFSNITISQPVAVQGGAYFTKIKCNNNPFYIQTLKCLTKQGLNETAKKAYIDLMYTNEDDATIEWFEKLEETLTNLIFSKRELWFQNEMDMSDIENNFNPVTRAYRGGKYHLVRVNIPKNKSINSQYYCNMYDENENIIPVQELNDKHHIIPILEIQGIKFSARSFQVELVGKQIMLLNNKPIFNSCLIKKNTSDNIIIDEANTLAKINTDTEIDSHEEPQIENDTVLSSEEQAEPVNSSEEENSKSDVNINIINELLEEDTETKDSNIEEQSVDIIDDICSESEKNDGEIESNVIDNTTVDKPENPNHLEEVSDNIIISENVANMKLKKPNEVYYEIYKITKQKAKEHKKAAISHYLEAKKIKNTYLLEDIDNSDSSDDESLDGSKKLASEINDLVEELA